jgi:two-component system sensor histidine kinase KdpD
VGTALAAVTAVIILTGPAPMSPWRHAFLVPVIAAALAGGLVGGALAAGGAVLLSAPFVLSDIERTGLGGAATEGLVSFVIILALGGLAGALRTRASRQAARFATLVAIQRALAADAPLDVALARLRAVLIARLAMADVALVVRDGDRLAIAGGESVAPGSLVARTLEHGESIFVNDTGEGMRPRRALAVPLTAGGERLGVLAVERVGELPDEERRAIEALGAQLGLALENARLASRQRRFAEELAERIAEATHRLEEMDRAKSAFVAIASHELRTPLSAILGFAELLALRRFPAEEVRRLAEIIRGETDRLVRIVNDLLDLSRLERGLAPVLRRAPVAVEPALGAAVELFRRGSASHRFVVECAPSLLRVDADPDALDRILKNLVSNAVKYSPPGSTVTVTARGRADGSAVELTVADEGAGIPRAALPRVFEPYYRAPDALGAARGAGIGLAVVKALVDAHGGSIRVDSAPEFGTRVTFELPSVP